MMKNSLCMYMYIFVVETFSQFKRILMVDSLIFFNTIIVIKNGVFISFSDKVYEGDFTLGDHDSELIII